MSVVIEARGLAEVLEVLDRLEPKAANKVLGKATAEAAKKVLKPAVKAETKWAHAKRGVRAGAARKEKPAGIVKYDAKRVPDRHWMLHGTKKRFTKKGANRGRMVGDPIISRVADANDDRALDVVAKYLETHLDLD